ncbi:hypothetical protein VMT65_11575 [Nocardia sp. CDC153]|uniref:Rv1733c family protein n=1 Tax=Nocardia sp. CDC153 TaxID=3112167 RepID=UPI002DBAACA0|nr:hypothetical protein [Nocardia sp. CDC153]MEC3953674.1 hypothetical protein [Nocardia sp. CDC153]
MRRSPSTLRRTLRTAPWSRNPLMRPLDRLEGCLWILALLAAVAVLPLAAAWGNDATHAAAERIRLDNASKVRITATLTGDPVRPATGDGAPIGQPRAPVRWNQLGHAGNATVEVPDTAKSGDPVDIWLNRNGHPTGAPRSLRNADAQGLDIALLTVLGTWYAVSMLVWGGHRVLTHRRESEWGREWQVLGRGIGHEH